MAYVDVPLKTLLSDGFASSRACLIKPDEAAKSPVPPGDLRLLTLRYWGFDGRVHQGRMVVNASVADGQGVGTIANVMAASRTPLEGTLIVCIENEPAIIDAMRTLLTGWGAEVIAVMDGAAAVAAIEDTAHGTKWKKAR